MIILDTSVWIEFYRNNGKFFTPVSSLFQVRGIMGLPWIFGELLQGAKGRTEVELIKETWSALPKPSSIITENSWLIAGEESSKQKWYAKGIGLIDAAIIIAAATTSSKVWTLDKNLANILKSKNLLFET